MVVESASEHGSRIIVDLAADGPAPGVPALPLGRPEEP